MYKNCQCHFLEHSYLKECCSIHMSTHEQKEKLPREKKKGLPAGTGSASIKSALDARQRVVGGSLFGGKGEWEGSNSLYTW